MSAKEAALAVIGKLPEDVSIEDIMAELYVRKAIDEGLRELDEGKGISHDEAKQRMAQFARA